MAEANVLTRAARDAGPGGARDERVKGRQIIDGARRVFLADGFDGASMNDIARVAGVSKGTLYVYFASKEELFAALIREDKQAQAERLCHVANAGTDLRTTLIDFGSQLMELMLRPESIAQFRIVAAVGAKFPAIGKAFYEAGPEYGRKRIAEFLDRQVAAGLVAIPDTSVAAAQFTELCKATHLLRAILGVGEPPSRPEIEQHVTQAVDMFLKGYAP